MAWMAPIAVAAHQKQEEAAMLKKLMDADPEGRYEFKIIRAGINGFRNQEYFDQVLDIEMQGSWEFVEKIDNARVVLRRSINSKMQDVHLNADYDPYRINYGSGNANAPAILLGLVMLVGLMFLFGYQYMQKDTGIGSDGSPTPMIIVAITLFLLVMLVMVKLKRK